MPPLGIQKIISGGQTGVDRAALDFAIKYDIPHGGWCPKGRRAEDGVLPKCYQLKETPSLDYKERTEWNVRDTHGTLIISDDAKLTGGTKYTLSCVKKYKKPYLIIAPHHLTDPVNDVLNFLKNNQIHILNVAGPRASKSKQIYEFALDVLTRTLKACTHYL